MSHNAQRLNGTALTSATAAPALNDLLGAPPVDGAILTRGASTWEGAAPGASGAEARAGALTPASPSGAADPNILSNSTTRSYGFLTATAPNIATSDLTYLGAEAAFGAGWNSQFRIDAAGVWLITAHLTPGVVGTPATNVYLRLTATTTLTGAPSAGSSFGPLFHLLLRGRSSTYAHVLQTTGAFSFRFAGLYTTASAKNIPPALVQLQTLEITRLA